MSVYSRITSLLDQHKIEYQVVEHPPVITCDDAANVRGTSPDQGAKALICIADKSPILVVLPCSHRLDLKGFKKLFHIKDLRLASPSEVLQLTGLEVGSIPPIGPALDLPTYCTQQLLIEPQICFNAGSHTTSILMSPADYQTIVQPITGTFTNPKS